MGWRWIMMPDAHRFQIDHYGQRLMELAALSDDLEVLLREADRGRHIELGQPLRELLLRQPPRLVHIQHLQPSCSRQPHTTPARIHAATLSKLAAASDLVDVGDSVGQVVHRTEGGEHVQQGVDGRAAVHRRLQDLFLLSHPRTAGQGRFTSESYLTRSPAIPANTRPVPLPGQIPKFKSIGDHRRDGLGSNLFEVLFPLLFAVDGPDELIEEHRDDDVKHEDPVDHDEGHKEDCNLHAQAASEGVSLSISVESTALSCLIPSRMLPDDFHASHSFSLLYQTGLTARADDSGQRFMFANKGTGRHAQDRPWESGQARR
eukprot:726214-Rhodomonas_salina.1